MGSLDRELIPQLCRTEIEETSLLLCKEMVWTHPDLPETFPDCFNSLGTIYIQQQYINICITVFLFTASLSLSMSTIISVSRSWTSNF